MKNTVDENRSQKTAGIPLSGNPESLPDIETAGWKFDEESLEMLDRCVAAEKMDHYVEAELEFYRPDWDKARKEFKQFPSKFPKPNPDGTYPQI